MPPSASLASSINSIASVPTTAAATLLTSSTWIATSSSRTALQTLSRRPLSVLSSSSSSIAFDTMTATPPAFATGTKPASAANIRSASPTAVRAANQKLGNNNMFSKLWKSHSSSSRNFSFLPLRKRSYSISSVPSLVVRESACSSSASSCDDSISSQLSSASPSARRFSSSANGSGSKLSSSRGRAAIQLLPTYLIDARAITQYSPSTPEGALQLSVAENQLSELPVKGLSGILENTQAGGIGTLGNNKEMRLVDVLSTLASSTIARPYDEGARAMNVFERDMIYYQPTQGVPSVRQAMAEYLQGLLVSPTHPSLSAKFNPDNIVLGAGCNAVLENLCMVLADPGDAVLIPTPYYAAFEFDLVARAGCHIVPVNTLDHHDMSVPSCKVPISPEFYYPNRSSLEHAYTRAVEETGRAPRVLLLSHPNNPLGICYPPSVVQECIDWCREKEVHLISDEIYAGSVYRKERRAEGGGDEGSPTFVSAMALGSDSDTSTATEGEAGLGLGPYIHLVYAFSKDFALSGLRVGVAYTENEEILMPLQKLNDLCQISSQTQLLVERMVTANAIVANDEESDQSQKFVDVYLQANQDNIRERCDTWQSCLDEVGIPHLPADSGLFVWMDFREFLPSLTSGTTEATESLESKEQRERQLYLSLMKEYGLLFTPGMSMRNERPGFFRCVFTAASQEEFELSLVRLRKFVDAMRS